MQWFTKHLSSNCMNDLFHCSLNRIIRREACLYFSIEQQQQHEDQQLNTLVVFFDKDIEDFMEALELVSDGNVELLAYTLTFYGCCFLCKMAMVFILHPRIMMIWYEANNNCDSLMTRGALIDSDFYFCDCFTAIRGGLYEIIEDLLQNDIVF